MLLEGCSFERTLTPNPDSGIDGDAPTDRPADLGHILLSEVFAEGGGEFVEIYNPTAVSVLLTDYYLTDVNTYWRFPAHPTTPVTVPPSDFFVRFPAGTMLAPGTAIVIAADGAQYQIRFGSVPDFTIAGTTGSPMIEAIAPITAPLATRITDDGELVVLFTWDGASDLVADVDIVVHGVPPAADNKLAPKQPVDGPDVDTTLSAYRPEPAPMTTMTARTPDSDQWSYARRLREDGHELAAGGNGITGHDETAEDIDASWNTGSTPPSPGTVTLP